MSSPFVCVVGNTHERINSGLPLAIHLLRIHRKNGTLKGADLATLTFGVIIIESEGGDDGEHLRRGSNKKAEKPQQDTARHPLIFQLSLF